MKDIELNNLYLVDEIELEEGQSSYGPQIIECIAKSTTKNLFLLKEHNLQVWLPFDRKIKILEKL